MAITVNLYDLENYPDNAKTGTVDVVQMVPTGYRGDEQYALKFSTNAYSDFTNKTAITDIYIQEMVCGWAKSSGFAGSGGKFTITSSNNELRVNIDGCTGGSYSGYYVITLDEGVNIPGETVAADIEAKLRAVSLDSGDSAKALGYKNCICTYRNARFMIKSGSVSSTYTGSNKSSVKIYTTSFANSATATLGFDMGTDSETIASTAIKEVITTANYTVGGTTLSVSTGLGVTTGDALYITDGVNSDYFVAVSGTLEAAIHVPNIPEHNFNAILNNYTAGAKVQLLKPDDPEVEPISALNTVDDVCRWGVMSLINQIDFSG
jgi:hypothetical protein